MILKLLLIYIGFLLLDIDRSLIYDQFNSYQININGINPLIESLNKMVEVDSLKKVAGIIILTLVALIILASGSSAIASRPITSITYPPSASTGTVIGRVTTTANGSIGLSDAYIAIVNNNNVSQEYADTISNSTGGFNFTGVSTAGSYRIYANKTPPGEGFSATFSVSANNSTMVMVVIDVTPTPTPTPIPTTTPTPTPTPIPTTTPTPTPIPTTTPTPTPIPTTTPTPTPTTSATSTITTMTPTSSAIGSITQIPTPKSTVTPAIPALMAILIIGIVAYLIKNKD